MKEIKRKMRQESKQKMRKEKNKSRKTKQKEKKIGSESEVKVKVRIFLSPISLKIGSVVVQDEKIFAIFVFSDFAQKMWKKIRFKSD